MVQLRKGGVMMQDYYNCILGGFMMGAICGVFLTAFLYYVYMKHDDDDR